MRIINYLINKLRILKLRTIWFLLRKNIKLGENCLIKKGVKIDTYCGGKIEIGDNCKIHEGAMLLTYGGDIKIGHDCSINPYCILYGHGGLTIGNHVSIATHTIIIPANHNFDNTKELITNQGITQKGIHIEDNIWLGANVKILDGVIIKTGCVVGAGSVVTKNTENNGIYAGVPAKLIKKRGNI